MRGCSGEDAPVLLKPETHSWFIGFAPCSDHAAPRYAFACVVENGGYGHRVAAAVCHDMLKKLP